MDLHMEHSEWRKIEFRGRTALACIERWPAEYIRDELGDLNVGHDEYTPTILVIGMCGEVGKRCDGCDPCASTLWSAYGEPEDTDLNLEVLASPYWSDGGFVEYIAAVPPEFRSVLFQ